MRRMLPLTLTGSLLILLILGCSGTSGRETTRQIAKVIPVVETISEKVTREPVKCDPAFEQPTPRGCTSATLTCGSVVEGNNTNQPRRFGDEFYVSMFCVPQRHYYEEAGEAVYRLEMPANIKATVRLDNDCADLDVAALSWSDTDSCPAENTNRIAECEMTDARHDSIVMTTVDNPQVYLIVVDGKQGATGNFRLTVKCETYR